MISQGLREHREPWDRFTFRILTSIGVDEGWRCLEIGARTGSVAAWLQQRVGRRGLVVATDIESRWVEPRSSANLVVRHHSVLADPIAVGYDLIHARLVLNHLPQREAVARKLVAALCPGGWLVVEDHAVGTMRTGLLDAGFTDVTLAPCDNADDTAATSAPTLVAVVGRRPSAPGS
jgi:SAM-dependent methyltransferase